MWEAAVRPEVLDEFVRWLTESVWPLMSDADGFAGAELYTSYDGPTRLVLVSHWRDDAALERFAGPAWRHEPVVGADPSGDFLERAPHVWHFIEITVPEL